MSIWLICQFDEWQRNRAKKCQKNKTNKGPLLRTWCPHLISLSFSTPSANWRWAAWNPKLGDSTQQEKSISTLVYIAHATRISLVSGGTSKSAAAAIISLLLIGTAHNFIIPLWALSEWWRPGVITTVHLSELLCECARTAAWACGGGCCCLRHRWVGRFHWKIKGTCVGAGVDAGRARAIRKCRRMPLSESGLFKGLALIAKTRTWFVRSLRRRRKLRLDAIEIAG